MRDARHENRTASSPKAIRPALAGSGVAVVKARPGSALEKVQAPGSPPMA